MRRGSTPTLIPTGTLTSVGSPWKIFRYVYLAIFFLLSRHGPQYVYDIRHFSSHTCKMTISSYPPSAPSISVSPAYSVSLLFHLQTISLITPPRLHISIFHSSLRSQPPRRPLSFMITSSLLFLFMTADNPFLSVSIRLFSSSCSWLYSGNGQSVAKFLLNLYSSSSYDFFRFFFILSIVCNGISVALGGKGLWS